MNLNLSHIKHHQHNQAQKRMLNPNSLGLAQGLSRVGASQGLVGSSAYIPSLLQSSDIEDLPYLWYGTH